MACSTSDFISWSPPLRMCNVVESRFSSLGQSNASYYQLPRKYFFMKILSAFYACFIYSCALDFIMEAKVMNLDQTASLGVGLADN